MTDFGGKNCELFSGHSTFTGGNSSAAIIIPLLVLVLVGAAMGSWYIIKKRPL